MTTKDALLAVIDGMTEAQMQSLLVLLDSFSTNAPQVAMPAFSNVRADMMQNIQNQLDSLANNNYSSPNAVDVMKELKDMLNMLLRV